MENHPIPQDVTGFQFKLIGNMTVKQFAYVAVGGVSAVLLYYIPVPFLLKLPFMVLFGLSGLALAFFPLDGRPLDVMFGQFLKALLFPNQYLYQKQGMDLSFSFIAAPSKKEASKQIAPSTKDAERRRLLTQMLNRRKHHGTQVDEKEGSFLSSLFGDTPPPGVNMGTTGSLSSLTDIPTQPLPPPPVPYITEKETVAQQTHDPEKIEEILKQEAEKARRAMTDMKAIEESPQSTPEQSADAHARFLELQKQLDTFQEEQKQIEEQLKDYKLKTQVAPPVQNSYTVENEESAPEEEHVKKITPLSAKTKGILHLPDTPNVVVGVVYDPRENILPQILVEIKDQDGNPVRAFKTNELGQFASATPLPNGVYTISFEDPKGKNRFDTIELVANGEILAPIEVISHDEREELRKALFS